MQSIDIEVNSMRVRACKFLVAKLSSLKQKIPSYFGHCMEEERHCELQVCMCHGRILVFIHHRSLFDVVHCCL